MLTMSEQRIKTALAGLPIANLHAAISRNLGRRYVPSWKVGAVLRKQEVLAELFARSAMLKLLV